MRARSAFVGGMFTVGTRWADRLLGLGSTLVLARLLTPADFGLVAMATVIVGLIEILLDLGTSAALVQKRSADRADFDTAWTLKLIQCLTVAFVIALVAPLAGGYYGDARVPGIMWVIALSIVVGSFENIGVVTFQRNMEFHREFQLQVSKRMIGVSVTVILAFALHNYWALLIGTFATRLAGVSLGYWMHPFRPKLSLSRVDAIWSFSKWNILLTISNYVLNRSDKFVVGSRTSPATMGAYTVADELASLPTSELLAPLGRVMFPAFVRVAGDPAELRRVVMLSLAIQALVGIPAAVGMALVAPLAVPVLLGPQWGEAIPFVQLLCASAVVWSMASSSHYLLLAAGHVRRLALANFGLLVFFIVTLAIGGHLTAVGVATVRVVFAALAFMLLSVLAARYAQGLTIGNLLAAVWRPIAATVVMVIMLMTLEPLIARHGNLGGLVLKSGAGVVVYATSLLALWIIAGRPQGGEAYLVQKMRLTLDPR